MQNNNQNNLLLIDFFYLFLLILLTFFSSIYPEESGKYLVVFALVSNIQQMIRMRSHDYIVVFLVFSLLYWLFIFPFYFYGVSYHYLLNYQTASLTNFAIILQLFFLRLMFFGVDAKKISVPRIILTPKNNILIFSVSIILLILFIGSILYITPISIFSDSYGIKTKSSSLLEYALIPLIGAYLYANTKNKRFILFIMLLIFALLPLLYGKRLAFLMICLLVFNLFFSGKFQLKFIIALVVLLYFLLRFIAVFRIGMIDESDWLFLLFGIENNVMSNNHGGVMVSSVTYLGLIEEGVYDWSVRLKSFLGTILGVFIPSSFNFKETYIHLYTARYAKIPGNGGFIGVHLFFLGGWISVFLGGLFFNKLLRKSYKSRFYSIYLIFVMVTFPRWHSYNILILIKMGFWLICFILIIDYLDKILKTK